MTNLPVYMTMRDGLFFGMIYEIKIYKYKHI